MSAHFSPMNTLHTSKLEWKNNTLMKICGTEIRSYVQVFTWTTPWKKKQYKKTTRENKKAKEFSSLCHCYHRVYNGDNCPLRITLLDRFAWKPASRCMMIYENLTDELSLKLLESKLSIKTTEHFCKSGGLFNCEEKREDTVICHILKLGGPWKFFASWHQTWATLPQKQKFHHKKGRCCPESP